MHHSQLLLENLHQNSEGMISMITITHVQNVKEQVMERNLIVILVLLALE